MVVMRKSGIYHIMLSFEKTDKTAKWRIVFDASARDEHDVALNNYIVAISILPS